MNEPAAISRENRVLLARRHACLLALVWWALPVLGAESPVAPASPQTWRLQARVIAVGLPGVGGVRQIGRFHTGGPIPGNPEFLLQTHPGRVLDPERVMVAVDSNFGLSRGHSSHAAGAVLSIDPHAASPSQPLVVPGRFAAKGGQSEALGGAVRLYTAQGKDFQNRRYNAGAFTADYTAASGPRYLSMNNAFGRPWIANAPFGLRGEGSVTVVDPNGVPLANAPSGEAGGVFAGKATNRRQIPVAQPSGLIAKTFNYRASPQLTAGALAQGALGTAFLGPSPDGSGFAVFAVVTADGSVTQVHVQDGVDGLAPGGTVGVTEDQGVIGVAFQWNPQRFLYLADATRDRLVRLQLEDDRRQFKVARTTYLASPALSQPVDVAAAVPEIANPRFASHTTLAGGSHLYVANRGDGSLVRLDQDGRVVARADINIPGLGVLGPGRVRAIAVSADAQRIWLTLQGELPGYAGLDGLLIEVSAFDAGGPFQAATARVRGAVEENTAHTGELAFHKVFTLEAGLGPLFNARSCVTCHPGPGGASTRADDFALRVARMDPVTGRVTAIEHPNSPVVRRFSTKDLGQRDAPPAVLPRQANVTSLRMPLSLYASGRLDDIPDAVIEAQAVSKGDGIKGRVHYVNTANGGQSICRFGWKAQIATLNEMVADAFANELGIESALAVYPQPPLEDDGTLVRAVADYLRSLRVPRGPVR